MSVRDLDSNFMADIYANPETNRYTEGPGALLDDNCQPGALASIHANSQDTSKNLLCVKRVPKDWDGNLLQRALSDYGSVIKVSKYDKGNCLYWFAECKTVNDMEAILKGMTNNIFKIEVTVKTEKKPNDIPCNNNNNNKNIEDAVKSRNREVDMSRRNFKDFVTNPRYKSSNCANDEKNSRNRLPRNRNSNNKNNIIMNECKMKAELCEGSFDPKTETVNKMAKKFETMSYGTCKLCGKICSKYCERCHEHYCSVECQTKNWPQHRFYCFKMPDLISPHNEETILNNKTMSDEPTKLSNSLKGKGKESRSDGAVSKKLNSQSSVKKDSDLNRHKLIQTSDESNPSNFKEPNVVKTVNQKNIIRQSTSMNNQKSLPLKPPAKSLIPKSGTTVILTHIHTSNRVVIRSGEQKENEDYVKLVNKVNSSASTSKSLTDLPKEGSFCLAEFDNWYYRAEILKVNSKDDIESLYIDFGNIESKKLSDLKVLSAEFYEFTQYPFEVELKNCDDFVTNDKLNDYLSNLVDNSVLLKVAYDSDNATKDGKLLVDLRNIQKNESVNQAIMKFLSFEMPKETDPPIMGIDIISKDIDSNETKNLIVLDVTLIIDGIIMAIPEQYMEELRLFNLQLKEYALKYKHSTCPRSSEMCVAEYQGEWRRAKCYEAVGDCFPLLEFIDFGDCCPIPVEKIRKYPQNTKFPLYSTEFRVSGLDKLLGEFIEQNNEIEDYFKSALLHKVITPQKIVKINDSLYEIEMPEVIDMAINVMKRNI